MIKLEIDSTNNIFVIAPENVEISGEFKEEIKSRSSVVFPWASNK